MAENTVTMQDILRQMAYSAGETRGAYVASYSAPSIRCPGMATDARVNFQYALATILGKGTRSIATYLESSETVTMDTEFSPVPAGGDLITFLWFDPDKRALAEQAVNEAIALVYPYWYRETVVNAAAAAITLASGTDYYTLPAAVDGLIAVGIQTSSSLPIEWYAPKDLKTDKTLWVVEGQAGNYTVRFTRNFMRGQGIHEINTGQKLCLWYATRESALTALTGASGSTQLPLDYFTVASQIYARYLLARNPEEMAKAAATLPQLDALAPAQLQKLGIGKRPPNELLLMMQKDNSSQGVEKQK